MYEYFRNDVIKVLHFRNHHETSGAYLFLPDKEAESVPIGQAGVVLIQGPIMSTISTQLKHIRHSVKIKNSPGIYQIQNTVASTLNAFY